MQYKIGTVSVTNGSQIVTGLGTLWLANIVAGALLTVPGDNVTYEVATVDSDTQVTLNANYAGSTDSGLTYAMHRDFTSGNIPLLSNNDIETGTIFSRAMAQIQDMIGNNTIVDNGVGTSITIDSGNGVTFASDVNLADGKILNLGTDNDLRLVHTGASASIDNYIGTFFIVQRTNAGTLALASYDSGGAYKNGVLISGATPNCKFHGDGVLSFSTKASSTYRTINFASIPISATGLSAGDVWSNGGALTII